MSVSDTQLLSETERAGVDEPAIEINGLSKCSAPTACWTRSNLTAERGQLLALLGPNGAGKTATVRILATLLAPDAGHARVAGYDVVEERRQVRQRLA